MKKALKKITICLMLISLICGVIPQSLFAASTTVVVGDAPCAAAVNPYTNRIYVANSGDDTVSVIDGSTDTVLQTVICGDNPYTVAVNTVTNKIYVANFGGDSVTVIDGSDNSIATVTAGDGPVAIAVNPVTNKIYVANQDSDDLTVIDGDTNSTVTVPVGDLPTRVAVNMVTNKIYVVNTNGRTVSVIDGSTNTVSATPPTGLIPSALAMNPVTNKIYVANAASNNVTVIDGSTDTVSATAPTGAHPLALAVNTVTNKIYAANYIGNSVTVINGTDNSTATVPAGNNPRAITANAVTNRIYNANMSGNVTVINGSDNSTTLQAAGDNPFAVAVNPVTDKIYVVNSSSDNVTAFDGTGATAPVISLQGNSHLILSGDATPSTTDHTDFASTNTGGGTVDRTFTITNGGSAQLNISGTPKVVLSGANAADFSVTADPAATVAAGGSTTFTVRFTPSAAGARTATVTIANNDGNGNPYTFDIKGTGTTPAPEINVKGNGNSITSGDVTPSLTDYTDYGSTDISGGTVDRTFTIENSGLGQLNISGTPKVALSGANAADFSVTVDPAATVAPGGNTTFTVRFDPSAAGVRSAAISIASDDSDENPYTLAIQGTGTTASGGGDGGGGASTPSTTVTGSVIDDTGNQVSKVEASVTTDSNGKIDISMNASQAVVLQQPDGTASPLSDTSKIGITTAAGTPVAITANGTIQVQDLAKGTDNIFTITYDLGNGQKITIGTMEIKIDNSGNVTLTTTLIDPYGTIIDAATGQAMTGVNVTLYYANTARNIAAGKTPGTVVSLPGIAGFKPGDNKNPQISDNSGAYGFMVYPTTDYYIVATKDGYTPYKSMTIPVEQEIVKWDFKINKPSSGILRLSGLGRVDTALAIAKASYTGTLKSVVLATADNYPDALAGSVLAYKLNAPVLLVGSSAADQEKVLDYMKANLDPAGTVYILGGTGTVGSAMENKITTNGFTKINRLGGADRYDTSFKIADQLQVKTGTPIVLAYGENYPDALAISSIAAEMQSPILLVQKDGLSEAAKKEIAAIMPTKVYIVGGEEVISAAVEKQVAQIATLAPTNIVRINGADRYATSLAVAKYFDLDGHNICVATGSNFPDALAGSVYAANYNASVILADGSLSDQVINYLKTKKLTGAALFGGEGVVSKDIAQQLEKIIGK